MKSEIMQNTDQNWIKGDLYFETIKVLFHNIQSQNYNDLFQVWKNDFINIHGHLDTQRKLDVNNLEKEYAVNLKDESSVFKLIFCLETYYSIVLRILAYKAVFNNGSFTIDIFHEDIFKDKGITNYTCKEDFNWFVKIDNIVPLLINLFKDVELKNNQLETDFIRELFENIFPTQVRHSMGEFYTPDWLANFVIDTVIEGDNEAFNKSYIDPACGSGTFIFILIRKFKKQSNNKIFHNVYGIDINPLTVLAAKTNYLLLYSREFVFDNNIKVNIPIYYADTIAANSHQTMLFQEANEYETIPINEQDYVVGNPPWVNWEYLPKTYRLKNAHLWQYYNLFSQKGMDASFIKEDISVLLTYVALDKYLKKGGKLAFVIKETLFKSVKQGEGFRKFKIQPTNTFINPYRVDDLTAIKPFKDAVTRTALFFVKKGERPKFPIDYVCWKPQNGKRQFNDMLDFSDIEKHIEFDWQKARPSDKNIENSGWITESEHKTIQSNAVLGKSSYVARTGLFTGGANGIFWLNIFDETNDTVFVRNITERAKNKMKKVEKEIEKEFVFPFLTGSELSFWEYTYSKYIICPHTSESKMYPVANEFLEKYPKTKNYFEVFKNELENRKGFTSFDKHIHLKYYYALQRIGEYTFAPYKVAWRFISKNFTPAVIEYTNDKYLGNKNIIGNEKIIFVGLDNKDEAYYLCGILSSTPYRETIESYMVGTQITPSIIKRLNIPSYDSNNNVHKSISEQCLLGHSSNEKDKYLNAIDEIVRGYLGL